MGSSKLDLQSSCALEEGALELWGRRPRSLGLVTLAKSPFLSEPLISISVNESFGPAVLPALPILLYGQATSFMS
jgi:hypothetical protein